MSKITQEAYDEEIKELMEGLGLTEEEAVEDAIKCFEMKVMFRILCLHRSRISEKYLSFCSLYAII